jgi:preprotein translocase SecE subunit
MAKTRAQRKAEKRKRQQAQSQRQPGRPEQELREEERAQEQTQTPVSGEVAEVEAVLETGAHTEDYGEHTLADGPGAGEARSAVPGVTPERVEPVSGPQAPAPSRADVGRPGDAAEVEAPAKETREERRARRKREKEQEKEQVRRQRLREAQRAQAEKAEKRRGAVLGFLASCWAELKKVQWPDRDTLVQASAVTLIFVVVMAAYLGGLDAAFNWMIKQLL